MGQEETSELVDELGLGIDSEITYIKWSNIDKDVSLNISKISRNFSNFLGISVNFFIFHSRTFGHQVRNNLGQLRNPDISDALYKFNISILKLHVKMASEMSGFFN